MTGTLRGTTCNPCASAHPNAEFEVPLPLLLSLSGGQQHEHRHWSVHLAACGWMGALLPAPLQALRNNSTDTIALRSRSIPRRVQVLSIGSHDWAALTSGAEKAAHLALRLREAGVPVSRFRGPTE